MVSQNQKVFIIDNQGSKATDFKLVKAQVPAPKADEVLIKHTAIGINFIDVEYSRGSLKPLKSPMVPGIEAVGVIEKTGSLVKEFKAGQRVGYATAKGGAYSELRTIKADKIFLIPDDITDEAAASNLTKGMTAHYLMRRTFYVKPNMWVLIHAAAGGVGHLMLRLAKHYKARVIATVSNELKYDFIKNCGCKHIINYRKEKDISELVLKATMGNGVSVAYDSIGKDTIEESIRSLADFGLLVSFGQASGKPGSIDMDKLSPKSLFVTSPLLWNYKFNRVELLLSAMEVFGLIKSSVFPSKAENIYPFADIPQAHKNILDRKSVGSSIVTFQ